MDKFVKIEIKYDKEGNEFVDFKTSGFTEFEVIGLLTYYRDKVEIETMRRKTKVKI
jgi:hypothetical protein